MHKIFWCLGKEKFAIGSIAYCNYLKKKKKIILLGFLGIF